MSVLEMWTVYDHPSDYPGHCVARKWEVGVGGLLKTDAVMTSETLDDLRKEFEARGLYCLSRTPGDDPKIVETWF